MAVLQRAGEELGRDDPPLAFWAFAWPGGLALARYLLDHPTEVAGLRVLDVAAGSGLCAIAAVRAGAARVEAVDIDPLAEAAATVNARANGVRFAVRRADVLSDPSPDVDVILAGDVSYEQPMATRMHAWLRRASLGGTRVLIGDPGRRYLPPDLEPLATYRVRTTREIEDAEVRPASVYAFPATPSTPDIAEASRPMLLASPAVEPDRERPVVDELDRHLGAEAAGLDIRHAGGSKRRGEVLVEAVGDRGGGGRGEAGAAAARRVGVERELADDDRGTADVEDRAVRAAVLVLEDPQLRDAAGEAGRRRLVVVVADAKQHEQPRADRGHTLVADPNGGA